MSGYDRSANTVLAFLSTEARDSVALQCDASVKPKHLIALLELAEAAREEHGGAYYHPECPTCVAVRKLEAEWTP